MEHLKRYIVIREIRNTWKRIVKITSKQTKKIGTGENEAQIKSKLLKCS